MKKSIFLALVVLTMACKKNTSTTSEYTVTLAAYGKALPYAVYFNDADMNWTTDSSYTNNYSKSFKATKTGQMYVLHGKNGKKTANDSIYVKMTLGTQEAHDSRKFSNSWADISVQLTSPQ